MEKKFLYRSSLKDKNIPTFQMLGIVSEIILSKELFKKNTDISKFLMEVFDLSYKEYVMRSRTLILSRTVRHIYDSEDKNYQMFRKRLLNFIEKVYYKDDTKDKKTKKNSVSEWVTRDN